MSKFNQKLNTTHIEWDDFISLITKLEKDGHYKFCLLISVGVYTGLRISDLLNLTYSDLLIYDTFTFIETKSKRKKSVKINKDLKNIVNRILLKSNITDLNQFIFINKYGTKPIDKSYVNVKLKELFSKYEIKVDGDISTHTLRKTFGIRIMEVNNYSNESLGLLRELFGHYNIGVTKKYLGIEEQEIKNVYDSLNF
jgi:integrase